MERNYKVISELEAKVRTLEEITESKQSKYENNLDQEAITKTSPLVQTGGFFKFFRVIFCKTLIRSKKKVL